METLKIIASAAIYYLSGGRILKHSACWKNIYGKSLDDPNRCICGMGVTPS